MAGTKYHLKMKAKLKKVDQLEPIEGPEDKNITYYFKLRCESCHEESKSELAAKLGMKDHKLPSGAPCNMSYSCKFCGNKGFVDLLGGGRPITSAETDVTIMTLRTWGFEPIKSSLNGGFQVSREDEDGINIYRADGVCLSKGFYKGSYPDGSRFRGRLVECIKKNNACISLVY